MHAIAQHYLGIEVDLDVRTTGFQSIERRLDTRY